LKFAILVETFEKMEQTSSRLLLTQELVGLLRKTPSYIIDKVVYLIQGKIYPDYEGVELGLAEKTAVRAIAFSTGLNISSVEANYRITGDLGDTARELMDLKSQTSLFVEPVTVELVFSTLERIAKTIGPGSQELKLRLISNLMNNATLGECRYIMKLLMGTLRLGIADYTVLDSLAIAFTGKKSERHALESAYNVSSDLGTVAKLLSTQGIEYVKRLKTTLFKPVRPMLAERARNAADALSRFIDGVAAAEYKLDGERIQIHKSKKKIELFSRRLEKVTNYYPDVVESLKSIPVDEMILEAEVVAINSVTEELLPFQELMHRRRKHGLERAIDDYPVVVNIFDVLYIDGSDKTSLDYLKRRKLLEEISKNMATEKIRLVPQVIVTNADNIENFMASAIQDGCEGLMIKQLNSKYRAGAREFAWMKLKREYKAEITDSLDLVVVGALFGRGRRVGRYGALLLAAYNPDTDIFESVCKVGAGFTDLHLEQFYSNLEGHLISHRHARVNTRMKMNVWFEPKILIEVIASEITLSPSHTAALDSVKKGFGLGLRFPKFTGKIREDKAPEDATTVSELISIYGQQIRSLKSQPDQR
jgi:DNA ligase-1